MMECEEITGGILPRLSGARQIAPHFHEKPQFAAEGRQENTSGRDASSRRGGEFLGSAIHWKKAWLEAGASSGQRTFGKGRTAVQATLWIDEFCAAKGANDWQKGWRATPKPRRLMSNGMKISGKQM